jgi:hypothetical protein
MNALNTVLKSVACGIAAATITAASSWSFVQSTSAAPGVTLVAQVAKVTVQPRHIWFGQSLPAVLVD